MSSAEFYARAISELEDNDDVDNLSQDGIETSVNEYDPPTANAVSIGVGTRDEYDPPTANTVSIGRDKTGGLLKCIRLLLILNFLISSSFFVYLV